MDRKDETSPLAMRVLSLETTARYGREYALTNSDGSSTGVVIEKQRQGAAQPGVVIFTDCRALVQALGGSGSKGVGGAVLLADDLQKTESVRTVVQYLLSHVGDLGNEIADGLANEGHTHNHGNHSLCRTLGRSSDAAPPSSAVRRSYLMMNLFPISMKSIRQVTSYKVCRGVML
ncbi:hypothetical protein PoB_001205900 [Plakobranchus ocellatus]|uniref:RNase H type-1 domain-containing protein n=1 Tax=Plakobranchus ocellatus TaxID=259542 RepID=A0AAV3YUE7_9GAST|nr:hypothetical protein PoB_001205900 [Plakobranchus ocellatus]